MCAQEEKGRFEGLNRRISRLFESQRLSAISSSSSNDRMSIATSLSTDLSDSDRPVSLVSTASSDSLQSIHCPYDNSTRASMTQPLPDYLQNQKADLNPDALETLQKDFQSVEAAAHCKVSQMHNNNNNAGNRRGLRGSGSLSPFAAKVTVITHKLSYVERVVLEIVETERMYVRDLRSIVEDYLGAIIDTPELPIKPDQVSDLFGNIEDIYELNSELLQDLDGCDNDPVAVARCFVEKSHYFDIYTQYCTNYPNSVAALTECMRNKLLAKFFRDRQETLKHSLPLGSFLLKPVQRILKYHLLLQEIAKHFDMETDGYEVVEEAIGTMTGVAWYINDMKRKHEHAVRLQIKVKEFLNFYAPDEERMNLETCWANLKIILKKGEDIFSSKLNGIIEIQSLLLNWKGQDLTMYGELVLEGTFRIQRARNERTLFLFYKALFITKKRGDHFVYKTHIPCSSLMLIESTRDSLCFTITHYKNSKQQHNIQVRTVEEKRLWTHHIKELLLENHHAIIPQKAKEAILEMDALYPSRYKYSPERVKKVIPTEDATVQGRQGRRQSEPVRYRHYPESLKATLSIQPLDADAVSRGQGRRLSEPSKHILKHLGDKVLLKHADSDGALTDIGDPTQLRFSPLACSYGQPEAPQEDVVEETSPKKHCPEHLHMSGNREKDMGAELTASDEEEEEEEEEVLMGDDQSKEAGELELPKLFKRRKSQSSDIAEKRQSMEVAYPDEGVDGASVRDGCAYFENIVVVAREEVEPCTHESEQQRPDVEVRGKKVAKKRKQNKVTAEMEQIRFPEESPSEEQIFEEMPNDLQPADHQEPIRTTQSEGFVENHVVDIHDPIDQTESENIEDLKTLSSEEEEEVIAQQPESILPPSVLNQASIIAERFVNSLSRRSSLALDDGKYVGCLTPRLNSRSGSTKSLDCIDKIPYHSSSSDVHNCCSPREIPVDSSAFFSPCFSPLNGAGSPNLESPSETDRTTFRRKDSTLSKQDRLLLDKIKGYYDHAESNDAAFSIKRRESLSYIPSGLVRNSVFKFNSLPRTEPKLEVAVRKRIASASNDADGLGGSRPASWAHPDVQFTNNSDKVESCVSFPKQNGVPASSTDLGDQLLISDDEFKPPSEMFKVWEEIEKARSNTFTKSYGSLSELESGKTNTTPGYKQNGETPSRNLENGYDLHEPLHIVEDSDLSTITEESPVPSPESTSPCQAMPAKLPCNATEVGQHYKMDKPIKLHPKILQLTQSLDGDMTDKMKSKVYLLARKYSQRIKCNKPVAQRHLKELEEDLRKNNPISAQEEKRTNAKGKRKPALLSLPSYDHVIIQEHSSHTPLSACSSTEKPHKRFSFNPSCTSPGIASPSKSACRSPLSPAEAERFHWPDVRQLRSKYVSKPGSHRVKSPPVNRSQSVPDSIADHCPAESFSIQTVAHRDLNGRSSSINIGQMSNLTDQTLQEGAQSRYVRSEPQIKLPADTSITRMLGGGTSESLKVDLHGADASYYVSAEVPLENNKKVIVMERLCNTVLLENPSEDHDDSYVQIRSPTSREKISLKAVVERCKAYQESDEYLKRESVQAEEAASQNTASALPDPKGTSLQSLWEDDDQNQQNRVKSLRKKFQTLGSNS